MPLVLHPQVYSDVDRIMEYYEKEAGPELADDFYSELRRAMMDAAERPESSAVQTSDIRRVNLQRFPYHFLFRSKGALVRILIVRHNHRHPSFGVHRR